MNSHTLIDYILNEELLKEFFLGMPAAALFLITAVFLIIISKGADTVVDQAAHAAAATGIPKVVIGATIVSLGTTLPEVFVSVTASWMGRAGLALGNGIGSIVADTGLILGIALLLRSKIPIDKTILSKTGWWQAGSATLVAVLSFLMLLFNWESPVFYRELGFVLLLLLVFYLFSSYKWCVQAAAESETRGGESVGKLRFVMVLKIAAGLGAIVLASRLMIPAVVALALKLGIPDAVVAATMVAFGTSVPELITAIRAVRRNHPEIAVGNIVGADVLNALFVIGASAVAGDLVIPRVFYILHFPILLLIIWSFRFFVAFNKSGSFGRMHGIWFLSVYLIYVVLQYAV